MRCALVTEAEGLCDGAKLLRTYWYDAVPGAELTPAQAELAGLPSLKLRMGVINGAGQQKGVDTLIVTDLVELARNRAISDAVVVSGDEDVRIAVSVAQSYGLRVHLLGVGQADRNTSRALRHEADTVTVLNDKWLRERFERVSLEQVFPVRQAEPLSSRLAHVELDITQERFKVTVEEIEDEELNASTIRVVQNLLGQIDHRRKEQLRAQIETTGRVPTAFDRPLVGAVSRLQGGRRLSNEEVGAVRKCFTELVAAATAM